MTEGQRTDPGHPAPVRVLHLITRNQPRGAESAAVALAGALADRGYRTRVIALADSPTGQLAGVPVLGSRPLGPLTLLRLRAEVRAADVVIAHGSRTLPAVVAASVGLRRALVYQNIGDPLYWAGDPWRRYRVRVALGRMTRVAALTDRAAAALREHFGVPAERLLTIRNFRDGSRFSVPTPEERRSARALHGWGPQDRVVAVVGALAPEKRVDLALEAAAVVPGAVLVVVGDGPERSALERKAQTILPGRVRFLGSLADVVGVLHAVDVLLMTSESEGVPGVLIEAGLCGIPSVTTDVGYVSEVVRQGETGLLVGSSSPDELGRALEQVLDDRERMGVAAHRYCSQHFELGRVADDWSSLVRAVVNEGQGRPSS